MDINYIYLGHIEDDFFNSSRFINKNYSEKNIGLYDIPENITNDSNYDNTKEQSNFIF